MNGVTMTAVPGPYNLLLGQYDLGELGYAGQEFFINGEATSYVSAAAMSADGQWSVAPSRSAEFKTRVVVLKPMDPSRFNGTVIVEWLNVTGGLDAPAEWFMAHREIVRRGYGYVAVSAQQVGVQGGPSRGADMSLKSVDPVRYASLDHPGDAYAFDIFTQAGVLVRDHAAALGLPQPAHILAVGESQSAMYLTTYINAIDPIVGVFDGYLVHSRFAPAAPLDGRSAIGGDASEMPRAPRFRADLRVPVMTVITETDLIGGPREGYHLARQPDADRLRTWEIAGTAHADNYTIQVGFIDTGALPIEALAAAYAPTRHLMGVELAKPINFAPQHHYVLQAALAGLDRWVRNGSAPPAGDRLVLETHDPATLSLDPLGVALGGVRTPWVDIPIAKTSGVGDESHPLSSLFGSGEVFDAAVLARLYPGGAEDYLEQFETSLDAAIAAGFILPDDRAEILALARAQYPTQP
jgi:hypothetical protein